MTAELLAGCAADYKLAMADTRQNDNGGVVENSPNPDGDGSAIDEITAVEDPSPWAICPRRATPPGRPTPPPPSACWP